MGHCPRQPGDPPPSRPVGGRDGEPRCNSGDTRGLWGGFCETCRASRRLLLPSVPFAPRDVGLTPEVTQGQKRPAEGVGVKQHYWGELSRGPRPPQDRGRMEAGRDGRKVPGHTRLVLLGTLRDAIISTFLTVLQRRPRPAPHAAPWTAVLCHPGPRRHPGGREVLDTSVSARPRAQPGGSGRPGRACPLSLSLPFPSPLLSALSPLPRPLFVRCLSPSARPRAGQRGAQPTAPASSPRAPRGHAGRRGPAWGPR